MKKAASLAIMVLILAGCEDKEVARKRNEELLPAGCKIIDLDYGDLRAAVVCEGRKTTTSVRSWNQQAGKTMIHKSVISAEISEAR